MKNKTLFAFFLLGSLFLIFQQVSSLELSCSNFTRDQRHDCNYIMGSGYSYGEEQELLNALWDQSSDYEGDIWNPDIPDSYHETIPIQQSSWLDNGDLILASKIFFFGMFNYIIFSITKMNFFLKWLTAV